MLECYKEYFIERAKHYGHDEVLLERHIAPLKKEESSKIWEEAISLEHQHLMQLNDKEWSRLEVQQLSSWEWEESWQMNDYDAFYNFFQDKFRWKEDERVLFFWMKESAVETTWRTLCDYWIEFMYEDELNMVINPKDIKALIIGINSYVAEAKFEIKERI